MPGTLAAKESVQVGLERCGLIEHSVARLVCYDKLTESEKSADVATIPPSTSILKKPNLTSPSNTESNESAIVKVIDPPVLKASKKKSKSFSGWKDKTLEPELITLKVTKCTKSKGSTHKYLFLF